MKSALNFLITRACLKSQTLFGNKAKREIKVESLSDEIFDGFSMFEKGIWNQTRRSSRGNPTKGMLLKQRNRLMLTKVVQRAWKNCNTFCTLQFLLRAFLRLWTLTIYQHWTSKFTSSCKMKNTGVWKTFTKVMKHIHYYRVQKFLVWLI